MTFRSLVIEEHFDAASAQAPYVAGADHARFGSLNAYTWRISAEAFAKAHNLAIDYIDNCWVRVALPAPLLRVFLTQGGGEDSQSTELASRIIDDRWFVINEEEF